MTPSDFPATLHHLAAPLTSEHTTLAQAWLERLDQLLDVNRRDVFLTHPLLDHIPDLLREVRTRWGHVTVDSREHAGAVILTRPPAAWTPP